MAEIFIDVDTALASVPVNVMPLIDATDFKTIEDAVVFNQAGLALFWNFTNTSGVTTVTAVTPTSAGDYDWTDFTTSGMYGIEIPASGGASINNDTAGTGHFTGSATGVLAWTGPKMTFRAAGLNNLLVDDAFSATRGLAGTALPAAAADAAFGLPISDAGGLDLDTKLANTNEITVARMGALTDWLNGNRLDLLLDAIKVPTDKMVFTVANQLDSNMLSVSGDGAAADNMEATYDGTGYTDDQAPAKQSQLDSIANVGSAVHKPAASYVLTTGTQSLNTVTATEALDGTNHEHADTAGAMELYYEFLIGGGTPTSVQVTGYVTGNNDDIDVYGYDWVSASFKQIGNMQGGSANNTVHSFDLFVDMVGSGADEGKVRVQFFKASGLTTATLAVDQIFVAFSQGVEGYENGAVWYDSNASNTSTEVNIDGTSRNPVSTEAAVNTLLASTGLHRVQVAPNSTYTFAASQQNQVFSGESWILALGGQDMSATHIIGAVVSGIATGASRPVFKDCELGTCTLVPFIASNCGLTDTLTFSAAGNYEVTMCHSSIAGSSTPIIDTGAAVADVNLTMPGYEQGIEIRNLNNLGADLFSISGKGQIIYAASSSGAVNQRGSWKVTNTGGVTITSDDNTAGIADVEDTVWDTILTGASHNTSQSSGKILRQLLEGGYARAAVWIDTSAAPGGDGTVTDPVDNITAALVVAATTGFRNLEYVTGSSDTLVAAVDGFHIAGFGYTLALGGQSISGTRISNGMLSGICTGALPPQFKGSSFTNTTLPPCSIKGGSFGGSVILGAGDYFFDSCFSSVAGTSAPDFDMGAATGNTNLNLRHYSGGAEIKNMGATGTDNMSLEGNGQLILNANCAGGTIAIRGNFTVTDNAGDVVTLSDDARFDVMQVEDAVWDLATAGHTIAGTFGAQAKTVVDRIEVDTIQTQVDIANLKDFDPAVDTVDIGKIVGSALSATNLRESALTMTVVTVGGVPTTTVIPTNLTETTNDHYKGLVFKWKDGALEGQGTEIEGYNGATKELTVTATTDPCSSGDIGVIL